MWYNAYTTEFKDADEGTWTVMIQSQEPPVEVIPFVPAKNPLEWKGKADGAQDECLLPTTGTLRLRITDDTLPELAVGKLLPSKFNDRRILVSRNGITAWQGFLLPETYDQDWVAPEFDIELTVCDTVSALSYVFLDGSDTSANIIQLLYTAYRRVGGELPIGDFLVSDTQLYYARNGAPTSRRVHWGSGELYPSYFVSPDNEDKKSYKDVIEVLLSPYGRLRQIGSRWYVGTDKAVSASLFKPNANGLGRLDGGRMATVVVDIDDEIAGTKNTQSILPPPSKVTLKYEPEDGAVDYSGDSIVKMDSDIIQSSYSNGPWDLSGLRYMDVSPENLKWPVKLTRRALRIPYNFTDLSGEIYLQGNMLYATLENRSVPDCTGVSQVLENDGNTYSVKDGLVLGQRRLFLDQTDSSFIMEVSADQLDLQREVLSTDRFCLRLKLKSQYADLGSRDEWTYSRAEGMAQWKSVISPMVQIYYRATANGPLTHILIDRSHRDTDPSYSVGPYEWETLPIPGIWPQDALQTSYIPVSTCESGLKFGIPNGRGYVTFVIYAANNGFTICEKDVAFHGDNRSKIETHSILTDFELSYSEVVADATHHLLEWNDEATSTVTTELSGGTEELTLEFKTLAGDENTAETYLAPRRGFCDSKTAFISRPRLLLDLGAVSLKNYDLAGVANPAVFRFNNEAYFPLSVGMDCRMNRASLKLIRTL